MHKHRFVLLTSIIIGASVYAPSTGDAQDKFPSRSRMNVPQKLSPFGLIESSFARKEISLDEWALYQAFCLLDPSKLPRQYRSAEPEKCGTWILNEIRGRWAMLSNATKSAMIRLGFTSNGTLARPIGLDSTRETAHFIVHYSVLAGDSNAVSSFDGDANGTPDYIDTVLSAIEYVWDYEVSTMGYTAPPPDSMMGGDDRFDVYVFNLRSNLLGFQSTETWVGNNPNSPSIVEYDAYSSFLAMRNSYSDYSEQASPAIKSTVAHEFYHAIQFGYDIGVGKYMHWIEEATASWVEDEVYDGLNFPDRWLPKFFNAPWIPLDASNFTDDTLTYGRNHWYSSWIFFRYLSEHVGGPATIRELLERRIWYWRAFDNDGFDEIADVLSSHGTNFTRVFRDFTTANLLPTMGVYRYREGDRYPAVLRGSIQTDTTIQFWLPRHASHYYRISESMLPTCGKTLTVTFVPLDGVAKLGAQVVFCKDGRVTLIPLQVYVTLPGDVTPDSLFITALNFDFAGTTGTYKLTVISRLKEALYTLTDLGPIGSYGWINSVNNKGNVAGILYSFFGGFGSYTPVQWVNGSLRYLGGGDGGAFDINNNDQVVGYVRVPFGAHAYLWQPSGSVSMDTVTAGGSLAHAINDSGIAVGYAKFPVNGGIETNAQPFIWKNNEMTKLPVDLDTAAIGGDAIDINNHNDILGIVLGSGGTHVALWSGGGGTPADLGIAFNPQKLNDAGRYVGSSGYDVTFEGRTDHVVHPVIGSGGGFSDLGTIDGLVGNGVGFGINNAGDVVGYSQTAAGYHAFLYAGGLMNDLNSFLGFGTCWKLQTATAISDSGHIAGMGYPASDPYNLHGFLLSPTTLTGVIGAKQLPSEFQLYQNYPNPFNPATTIRYDLPKSSHVSLILYNVLGQQVAVVANSDETPGVHSVRFDGAGLPSGVYFYRLQAGSFAATKKLILMK